jgi:hypothetical protein
MLKLNNFFIAIIFSLLITNLTAGPLSGAICSAGCAALVCTCYAAAGLTFGTITAGAGGKFNYDIFSISK